MPCRPATQKLYSSFVVLTLFLLRRSYVLPQKRNSTLQPLGTSGFVGRPPRLRLALSSDWLGHARAGLILLAAWSATYHATMGVMNYNNLIGPVS